MQLHAHPPGVFGFYTMFKQWEAVHLLQSPQSGPGLLGQCFRGSSSILLLVSNGFLFIFWGQPLTWGSPAVAEGKELA
jgi:hypothetical protein